MKLIFSDEAIESIRVLKKLRSFKNPEARQLFCRTSIVLTAIRNLDNIDNCYYGKVRHSNDPNVSIGHLDRELKGCMAFNIDKSNRIVVFPLERDGEKYAVILTASGHYKDNLFIGCNIEEIKENFSHHPSIKLKKLYEKTEKILNDNGIYHDSKFKLDASVVENFNKDLQNNIFSISLPSPIKTDIPFPKLFSQQINKCVHDSFEYSLGKSFTYQNTPKSNQIVKEFDPNDCLKPEIAKIFANRFINDSKIFGRIKKRFKSYIRLNLKNPKENALQLLKILEQIPELKKLPVENSNKSMQLFNTYSDVLIKYIHEEASRGYEKLLGKKKLKSYLKPYSRTTQKELYPTLRNVISENINSFISEIVDESFRNRQKIHKQKQFNSKRKRFDEFSLSVNINNSQSESSKRTTPNNVERNTQTQKNFNQRETPKKVKRRGR